jgi:hypothetical protein
MFVSLSIETESAALFHTVGYLAKVSWHVGNTLVRNDSSTTKYSYKVYVDGSLLGYSVAESR